MNAKQNILETTRWKTSNSFSNEERPCHCDDKGGYASRSNLKQCARHLPARRRQPFDADNEHFDVFTRQRKISITVVSMMCSRPYIYIYIIYAVE